MVRTKRNRVPVTRRAPVPPVTGRQGGIGGAIAEVAAIAKRPVSLGAQARRRLTESLRALEPLDRAGLADDSADPYG